MKFRFKLTKKQITWGLTAFLVIAASLVVYALIYRANAFLKPLRTMMSAMMTVIYGLIIAYILSSVVDFIEDKILHRLFYSIGDVPHPTNNPRAFHRMRAVSILLTMCFVLFVFYVLFALIFPQLYASVYEIVRDFPQRVTTIYRLVNAAFDTQPELRSSLMYLTTTYSSRINTFFDSTVMPMLTSYVQVLPRVVASTAISVFNFFIGFIISVYVLYSKEHFSAQAKKMTYAFFRESHANEIVGAFRFIHRTFNGFLTGKLADSAIVGIICYIAVLLMRLPYPVLLAVIVGVTNLIPFFGPYIGGIMGVILLVLIRPSYALMFLIFVIILQLVDGNIIGPRILGNSTGLSGFWVIFSIIFFGAAFGVAGWLIGVPLFAVFYAFVVRLTEYKLEKRGLAKETDDYIDLAYYEKGKARHLGDDEAVKYHAQDTSPGWRKVSGGRGKKQREKNAA